MIVKIITKKVFNKDLINSFANTYRFCSEEINKFILLLRKDIYPHEYKDSWERFDEASLRDKEFLYSKLYLKKLLIKATHMLKKHLKNLTWKILVIIMTCMFKVIHYCLQVYLKILETRVLEYMNSILMIFCLHLD